MGDRERMEDLQYLVKEKYGSHLSPLIASNFTPLEGRFSAEIELLEGVKVHALRISP
jgi:hypothetical protein